MNPAIGTGQHAEPARRSRSVGEPYPSDLIGRQVEISTIAACIADIHDEGNAVLVRGDPGIGKSHLLRHSAALAADAGWTVLSVTGIETDASPPYAGLHLLLSRLLAEPNTMPAVQQQALATAFGMNQGPPPELFLVALAVLSLLTEMAAATPILLVVDDMMWLDSPTNDVLAFVARRISRDPILVIGAVRTGHSVAYSAADPWELELCGLTEGASRKLLAVSAAKDFDDPDAILRAAVGNPLALIELPRVWRAGDELTDLATGPTLPLTDRLEHAFAAHITELPPLTRDALLIAAVSREESLADIVAGTVVLSGQPVTAGVLEAAEHAGILRFDELSVRFRHPLVRTGILLREPVTRQRLAHAAMAAVLSQQPHQRSWHRAQAAAGPDDDVADDLALDHRESIRRGAVMAAVSTLERAAQLTTDSGLRGNRLLLAAEHAFGLGRVDLVDRLVTTAQRNKLSGLDQARAQWLREIFNDGAPGDPDRVFALCATAISAQAAGDVDLALNLLLSGALRCWWADTGPAARARVVQVAEQLPDQSDPRCLAVIAVAEPLLRGRQTLARLCTISVDAVDNADHLRLLGMAARAVGAETHAADFFARAETRLRTQGRLGLLSHVLAIQAAVRIDLGDWQRAAENAEEARQLARDTGQPVWNGGAAVQQARTAALRGDVDVALKHADDVELNPATRGINDFLAGAQLARGIALIAAGRPADAYTALRTLFVADDPHHHQREQLGGLMDLAEAAVHCGQRPAALAVLASMEEVAMVTDSPVLATQLLFARPVLADAATAEPLYLAGLNQDLTRWPWVRARIQFAYGCWLRRQRRGPQSREPLRLALATFELIGAATWAAWARTELRAAGERIDPPSIASPAGLLSPQELQVAQLAAEGLSNKDIGERLFLSPRTVASHLYRIFPKLGIRSRSQLASLLGPETGHR